MPLSLRKGTLSGSYASCCLRLSYVLRRLKSEFSFPVARLMTPPDPQCCFEVAVLDLASPERSCRRSLSEAVLQGLV